MSTDFALKLASASPILDDLESVALTLASTVLSVGWDAVKDQKIPINVHVFGIPISVSVPISAVSGVEQALSSFLAEKQAAAKAASTAPAATPAAPDPAPNTVPPIGITVTEVTAAPVIAAAPAPAPGKVLAFPVQSAIFDAPDQRYQAITSGMVGVPIAVNAPVPPVILTTADVGQVLDRATGRVTDQAEATAYAAAWEQAAVTLGAGATPLQIQQAMGVFPEPSTTPG